MLDEIVYWPIYLYSGHLFISYSMPGRMSNARKRKGGKRHVFLLSNIWSSKGDTYKQILIKDME